jgi:Domain of unknown function (DUF1918)
VHANVGDRLVIEGSKVDSPRKEGEVLAVGKDGGPPFRVRWTDGQEGVIFPGPDAHVVAPG